LSISFDRAADYYDETRALPAAAMERLVAALSERMRPTGAVLEIGAGTGRYLVPLRAAGVRISGVDISAAMLARLRAKDRSAPVALGDATSLPIRDGAFGSGLAVHVLHLIPTWRRALAELVRAVRARGLVFVDAGGGDNPVEAHFFQEAGVVARHPGLQNTNELEHELALLGARKEAPVEVQVVLEVSLGDYIDRLQAGLYSRCWALDSDTLQRAGMATRAWAAARLGNLETPIRVERLVSVGVYRTA
jgi:SAM-dependent methyltransferase